MATDFTKHRALVDAYFDGWNAHDASAVAVTFAPRGTYEDPTTGGTVPGADIGRVVEPLCAAFPDLSFERSEVIGDGSRLVVEWTLRGQNLGPLRAGLNATEKAMVLRGVDVFDVGEDGIHAARGYFDQKAFVESFGLMALIQPIEQGAAKYGYSMRVPSANTTLSPRPCVLRSSNLEIAPLIASPARATFARKGLPDVQAGGSRMEPRRPRAQLVVLSPQHARVIDTTWPREPEEESAGWRWEELIKSSTERFALLDADELPVAAWLSKKAAPVATRRGPSYRVDYVEVRGDLRGNGLGALTLHIAAARARELGADVIIGGAVPSAVGFFEDLGFELGKIEGWTCERGLTPICLPRPLLIAFAKRVSDDVDP